MSSLLDKAISELNKQMEMTPPDAKAALIGYADTTGATRFGVAARLPKGWALAANLEADWREKEIEAGSITIQKVWR